MGRLLYDRNTVNDWKVNGNKQEVNSISLMSSALIIVLRSTETVTRFLTLTELPLGNFCDVISCLALLVC